MGFDYINDDFTLTILGSFALVTNGIFIIHQQLNLSFKYKAALGFCGE